MRRGRPAAHVAFDEAGAQLAALSMISTGFGLLARLTEHFPADKVTEVLGYLGSVLGPERLCRGQHLDLRLGADGTPVTGERILEMYRLKTSTSLEAALVPLAMLVERPEPDLAALRRYADHAGIAFQLRDDILDLTATTEAIGKDAGHDTGKVNLVRVYGLAEAERLMWANVDGALAACAELSFDPTLLAGMVRYFATRRR
jgi:geranylgeranyl pyrophosphate synthase